MRRAGSDTGAPATRSTTAAHFDGASFALSAWGFHAKVTIWAGIVGVVANLVVVP